MSQAQNAENFRRTLKIFFEKGGEKGKGVPLNHFNNAATHTRKVHESDMISPRSDKIISKKKHYNKKVEEHLSKTKNRTASIILMTTRDDAVQDKVYFDIGQAHGKRFMISEDGGSIEFKVSGMYVIKFEGTVLTETDKAELEFRKTPKFNDIQKPFSKFNIGSGEIIKSTLLKFEVDDRLELIIRSSNDSPVAIGSGTTLILFKVEECY